MHFFLEKIFLLIINIHSGGIQKIKFLYNFFVFCENSNRGLANHHGQRIKFLDFNRKLLDQNTKSSNIKPTITAAFFLHFSELESHLRYLYVYETL